MALELNQELDKRENELNFTLESVNSELNETKLKLNEVNCEFETKYTDLKLEVKCAKETYEEAVLILKEKYQSFQKEKCSTIEYLERRLKEAEISAKSCQEKNVLRKKIGLDYDGSRFDTGSGQQVLLDDLIRDLADKDEALVKLEELNKELTEKLDKKDIHFVINDFNSRQAPARPDGDTRDHNIDPLASFFVQFSNYFDKKVKELAADLRIHDGSAKATTLEAFEQKLVELSEKALLHQAKAIKEAEELRVERDKLLVQINDKAEELDAARISERDARLQLIQLGETTKNSLKISESTNEFKLTGLQHHYWTQLEALRNQLEEKRSIECRRHSEELQNTSKRFELNMRESEEETRRQLNEAAKELEMYRKKVALAEEEREKQLNELQQRFNDLRGTHEDVLRRLTMHHRDSVRKLRSSLSSERAKVRAYEEGLHFRMKSVINSDQKCVELANQHEVPIILTKAQLHSQRTIDTLKEQVDILRRRVLIYEEDNLQLRRKIDVISELDQRSQIQNQMLYLKSYKAPQNADFLRSESSTKSPESDRFTKGGIIPLAEREGQSIQVIGIVDRKMRAEKINGHLSSELNNFKIDQRAANNARDMETTPFDSHPRSFKS